MYTCVILERKTEVVLIVLISAPYNDDMVPIMHIPMIIKKVLIHFYILFLPSGIRGIRNHNLDVQELQLALKKVLYTPELSGPINVND